MTIAKGCCTKSTKLDLHWIVGFVEGDGCFTYSESSGPMFIVHQADPRVLYLLQKYFGFGSVFQGRDGYWSYAVHRKRDQISILHFFNGKLFLSKRIIQFFKWVRALNKHYGTSYEVRSRAASFSLTNGWLCGFRDRDGSFGLLLSVRTDNVNLRLRVRFYLDQAYAKRDLNSIKKVIGGTISKKYKDNNFYHRQMIDTFNHAPKIINYFDTFGPLTPSLALRYKRYKQVYSQYKGGDWLSNVALIESIIQKNKELTKTTVYKQGDNFIRDIRHLS